MFGMIVATTEINKEKGSSLWFWFWFSRNA
jgi:hypothetical protein